MTSAHSALALLALGALVAIAAPVPALANSWQVCRMQLVVLDHLPSTRDIQARVDRLQAGGPADCPQPGAEIRFAPETADYQSMLPRKSWPKVGTAQNWRMIYLDGICKNDGNPAPCRITHYPAGW